MRKSNGCRNVKRYKEQSRRRRRRRRRREGRRKEEWRFECSLCLPHMRLSSRLVGPDCYKGHPRPITYCDFFRLPAPIAAQWQLCGEALDDLNLQSCPTAQTLWDTARTCQSSSGPLGPHRSAILAIFFFEIGRHTPVVPISFPNLCPLGIFPFGNGLRPPARQSVSMMFELGHSDFFIIYKWRSALGFLLLPCKFRMSEKVGC